MGIKYKFTFVIFMFFVLNVMLLLVFYKGYIYPNMSETIKNTMQSSIEDKINMHVSSHAEANALIETIKEDVFNHKFRNSISKNIIKEFMISEIFIIFILLFLTSIFIYYRYVKPLEELIQNMEDYGRGISPKVSRRRKDEIGKLQKQFVELTRSVETEKQKQNRIIASISHDFKTPLTSIMGYVERLLKKDFPKEVEQKYLGTIYSKSQNINELINEFDEYISYNFEGGISIKKYPVSYICNLIRAEYTEELFNIGVEFCVMDHCTEEELSVDLLKINRVIGNLINNSVKHMKEKPTISLTVQPHENGVLFTFEDNGCGVSDSELPFIFDPLYTSDKSRKVAGLGLSICKNIITAHKGTISAKNNVNGGLKICILMASDLERF